MKKSKIDIVLAKKSKQFREKAKQLGFNNLIFASPYQKNLNLDLVDAIIIKPNSLRELIEQINLAARKKKKPIIIASDKTNKITRKALENKKTYMLVMPTLNHVLCGLARKNNIIIGINLSALKKTNLKEKAKILEKMLKIARLCRKYKTKAIAASFAQKPEDMISAKDIEAFANSLGLA